MTTSVTDFFFLQALKCQACEGPLIFKPPNPDHTCLECGEKTKALNEMKQVLKSNELFTQGYTLMQTGNIQGRKLVLLNISDHLRRTTESNVFTIVCDSVRGEGGTSCPGPALGGWGEGGKGVS